jgi:hypothetical protein
VWSAAIDVTRHPVASIPFSNWLKNASWRMTPSEVVLIQAAPLKGGGADDVGAVPRSR